MSTEGARKALSSYSAKAAGIDKEVIRRIEIERTIAVIRPHAKRIAEILQSIKILYDDIHEELKNLEDEKLAIDQGQLIFD